MGLPLLVWILVLLSAHVEMEFFYHGLLSVRQRHDHGAPCFLGVTSKFWRGRIRWAMGQCRVGPCYLSYGGGSERANYNFSIWMDGEDNRNVFCRDVQSVLGNQCVQ